MNIKVLGAALSLALTAGTIINANAQKVYKEGYLSYDTEVRGNPATVKAYFTPDSSSTEVSFGAGNLKFLTNAKHDYFAVVLDIPVAGIKKAAIASAAELEQGLAGIPIFTFTPTVETKIISGFNCKKVIAKEAKSGKTYDVWITNDITVPRSVIPPYYTSAGGLPIQYTSFQQGQELSITIKSVTEGKAPASTFAISSDFEKVNMEDLSAGQ
jgi:hypothetical protein